LPETRHALGDFGVALRCGLHGPTVFSPEMRVPKQLFMAIMPVSVWFSSRPWLNFATRPLMRGLAAATMRVRKARPQTTVEEIGEEWQRMFPSRKGVPITGVENDTVYAEIHITCPHRGTGNVEGCYRMMEYDRKMLEDIGGQFVVLRSTTWCRLMCGLAVAIRNHPLWIEPSALLVIFHVDDDAVEGESSGANQQHVGESGEIGEVPLPAH
jgi:hypothetical protein